MRLTRRGEVVLAFAFAGALTLGALATAEGVEGEPVAMQRQSVDLPAGSWIVSEGEARDCIVGDRVPDCPSAGHLVVDCNQATIYCDDEGR